MQVIELMDDGLRHIEFFALRVLQFYARLYFVENNTIQQLACPLKKFKLVQCLYRVVSYIKRCSNFSFKRFKILLIYLRGAGYLQVFISGHAFIKQLKGLVFQIVTAHEPLREYLYLFFL